MPAIKKRILVVGGAGLLGTHLTKSLLVDGHAVTVVDNFIRSQRTNLSHLKDFGDLDILAQDLSEPVYVEMDEIYNLVGDSICANSSNSSSLRTSWHYEARNKTEGISNLLSLACSRNARLLQSTTAEFYPNSGRGYSDKVVASHDAEQTFSNEPIGDEDEKEITERSDVEILCNDFHLTYGLDVRIARVFNTYGPFMSSLSGGVLSNFIVQALSNRPITIYGNGEQTLSLCYVDDVIAGLRALMNHDCSISNPLNFGNPQEYSVFDIAQKIIALVGSSSSLVFKPSPNNEYCGYRPNIQQAKQLLDWQPQITLEEGLIRTITYFESALQRNTAWAAARAHTRHTHNRLFTDLGEIIS